MRVMQYITQISDIIIFLSILFAERPPREQQFLPSKSGLLMHKNV